MKRFMTLVILVAMAAGGGYFLKHFDIEGLDGLKIKKKAAENSSTDAENNPWAKPTQSAPPLQRNSDTIRIASFNIQVFGQSKSKKPHVMDILAKVVQHFDVVAIQEVRSKSQELIPNFIDRINSNGRKYDFVLGPRLGRTSSKEQYAIIYDAQSIEVDRSSIYTVSDRDDLIHREPLVAAFRVRGPPSHQAFTFTLINIHTDPDETDQELDALDDVFRSVRQDGRNEDDIILLGDLNVDDKNLGQLGQLPGITWLISGVPTNTRGTKLYDNIVLHKPSTVEFTGRAGVFDLMREYNLTMDEAIEVSDHLPIWAEFSIYEGGPAGRVATRPTETTAR